MNSTRRLLLAGGPLRFVGPTLAALAVTAGCSTPPTPAADPDAAPPAPADACISTRDPVSQTPLPGAAKATGFSASPVPLSTFMRTSGDTITGEQAILDFPVDPHIVEPDQAVVLTSFTVRTTRPGGW